MFSIKQLFNRYRGLPKEIYVLFIARVINSIGAFVFPLLTLILKEKIGLSEEQAGLCMFIIALSMFPFMFLGGKLADSFGRKKLIVIFQLLGASTYIACGLIAPSMTTVYLIGLASNFYAMSFPALDSMAMDITSKDNRKEAYSVLYMGHNLGFAIGPMLGGLLYRNNLPFVFIGDALTTIIATVLMLIFIKETMPRKGQHQRLPSGNENELEKHQTGTVLKILFKERPVLLFYALILMIYEFSYNQWAFTLPLQINDIFGLSGAQYFGFLASFNGILVIIFTPLITTLTRKMHPLIAIGIGGIAYTASFAAMGLINELALFFIATFVMTMGEIVAAVNGSPFVANHSPASHRGRINSFIQFTSGIGRTCAPLMGYVIAATNMMISWFVIAGVVGFGAIMMFLLRRMKTRADLQAATPAVQTPGQETIPVPVPEPEYIPSDPS